VPIEHDRAQININKTPRNTWVMVDALSTDDVHPIFKSIHFYDTKHKFFDDPIFCNFLRNMTPKKSDKNTVDKGLEADTYMANMAASEKTQDEMTNTEAEKDDTEIKEPPKPTIPGLPEE
jgi:hypothetical protein